MAKVHRDDWHRFAINGDLGTLRSGLPRDSRRARWTRSASSTGAKYSTLAAAGRRCLIVAKMAVRPDIAKKLGLRLTPVQETEKWMAMIKALFVRILFAKYRQNDESRRLLLGTGDAVWSSSAAPRSARPSLGKPPLWTGMVVGGRKGKDGLIVGGEVMGDNLQGELHMSMPPPGGGAKYRWCSVTVD